MPPPPGTPAPPAASRPARAPRRRRMPARPHPPAAIARSPPGAPPAARGAPRPPAAPAATSPPTAPPPPARPPSTPARGTPPASATAPGRPATPPPAAPTTAASANRRAPPPARCPRGSAAAARPAPGPRSAPLAAQLADHRFQLRALGGRERPFRVVEQRRDRRGARPPKKVPSRCRIADFCATGRGVVGRYTWRGPSFSWRSCPFPSRIRSIVRTAAAHGGSGSAAWISAAVARPRPYTTSMICRSRLLSDEVTDWTAREAGGTAGCRAGPGAVNSWPTFVTIFYHQTRVKRLEFTSVTRTAPGRRAASPWLGPRFRSTWRRAPSGTGAACIVGAAGAGRASAIPDRRTALSSAAAPGRRPGRNSTGTSAPAASATAPPTR